MKKNLQASDSYSLTPLTVTTPGVNPGMGETGNPVGGVDATAVHKTGDETVGGRKTFTQPVVFSYNSAVEPILQFPTQGAADIFGTTLGFSIGVNYWLTANVGGGGFRIASQNGIIGATISHEGYANFNGAVKAAQGFVFADNTVQTTAATGGASLGYTAENVANKGAADGYAPLVGNLVPTEHLRVSEADTLGVIMPGFGVRVDGGYLDSPMPKFYSKTESVYHATTNRSLSIFPGAYISAVDHPDASLAPGITLEIGQLSCVKNNSASQSMTITAGSITTGGVTTQGSIDGSATPVILAPGDVAMFRYAATASYELITHFVKNPTSGTPSVVKQGAGAGSIINSFANSSNNAGEASVALGGTGNNADGAGASIVGGQGNRAQSTFSVCVGGQGNWSGGYMSAIGGGYYNQAYGDYSTAVGYGNFANGHYSTASGGHTTRALAEYSTVGGGKNNQIPASSSYSTIAGGWNNATSGTYSTVGGGVGNLADYGEATVAGGNGNTSVGGGFVGGGYGNKALGTKQVITGGESNSITNNHSFSAIGGGKNNTITSGAASVIAGGESNAISAAPWGSVGGGEYNLLGGTHAVISGGYGNNNSSSYGFIGGGNNNLASGLRSVVVGGMSNQATGDNATVGGGENNQAFGAHSTVSGGKSNVVTGAYSSISGGRDNVVSGVDCHAHGCVGSSIGAACTRVIMVNCNGLDIPSGTDETYINNVLYVPAGVAHRNNTVLSFDRDAEYDPISSTTFTVSTATKVVGAVVVAYLTPSASAPDLTSGEFQSKDIYLAGKNLMYMFKVGANNKIQYTITVLD